MFENLDKELNSLSDTAREEKLTELEILSQSLEEKKKLADDYYNQLLRLKAEFDNFRKRTEKEKQDYLSWGKEGILLKQINLLDALDQAIESTKSSDNVEGIKKGLILIHQEFIKMLSSEGVKEISIDDGKFDPDMHEAIEKAESDQPENTIIGVIQKGYTINSRLIRPARVKVSKQKDSQDKQDTKDDNTLAQ